MSLHCADIFSSDDVSFILMWHKISVLWVNVHIGILSWPVPSVRGNTKVSFRATVFKFKCGASGIYLYIYVCMYVCMINWWCVDSAVAYFGYSMSPNLFQKFCTHLCWTFGDNYCSLKRNDKWTKYTHKNVYCKKSPACYFSIWSLKVQARILSWPVLWVRGNTKVSFRATVFRFKSGASGIYLFIYLYIYVWLTFWHRNYFF